MTPLHVLIVGAGPTGLSLAAELARFGIRYRLIESSPEPARFSEALAVQARTLEQFERYGIADEAVERGLKISRAVIYSEHTSLLDLSFDKIHSRYPYLLTLPQSETERLLIEHLKDSGGVVERGVTLASFEQSGDSVDATLLHADGHFEQIRADWLVGCDGAHSGVRHQAGIPFNGNSVEHEFFLGDVHLSGYNVPGDEIRLYMNKGNVVFIGRLSESVYRLIIALHRDEHTKTDASEAPEPPAGDLTLADFQCAVAEHADPSMILSDPEWITRFNVNQRKAAKYRSGRVFLAGDASDVHSPVAGQGMNTGIQDAANLGWKLAAVVRGAPPALLDTYDEERGRVGDALLSITSRGLAAATSDNAAFETIRDLILKWVGGLSYVQEMACGFVSEIAIDYRHSSLSRDHGNWSHLEAGDRAPDAQYIDADNQTVRLHERLARPEHLLLMLHVSDKERTNMKGAWAEDQILALHPYQDEKLAQYYCSSGKPTLYAIRPDGYIGFRGGIGDIHALVAYAHEVGACRQEKPAPSLAMV